MIASNYPDPCLYDIVQTKQEYGLLFQSAVRSQAINNYAQCLTDTGSFAGCDMNYKRPVEVDVNLSGEIDLNLDIN